MPGCGARAPVTTTASTERDAGGGGGGGGGAGGGGGGGAPATSCDSLGRLLSSVSVLVVPSNFISFFLGGSYLNFVFHQVFCSSHAAARSDRRASLLFSSSRFA